LARNEADGTVLARTKDADGDPETPGPARQSRAWLPLLGFAGALLLYAAVWKVPQLFVAQANRARLSLSRQEGGEWVPVPDGVDVPARSRLRFTLQLERPASVVLIGLNAERRATLYVPSTGPVPRVGPGTTLVGEQQLDDVPGPELFLAVLCNTPLPAATVVKAGERAAAAAGQPGRVATLDLGCPEARVLVRKEARR
jgi:hypothetical protein